MTQKDTPPHHNVNLQDKVDIQRLQRNADGDRLHSMKGFDPKFTDIVDYIIRITHEIWEEKSVGKLYEYYANTIQIHTPGGTTYGRESVIAGTLATLAAYPDRRLYGDEVIWTGDDVQGFYSSHRITHTGTNRGWSAYGAPTGKSIRYRAIADCVIRENVVVEEWLVRDELTLVHQLGLDPVPTAKRMAKQDLANGWRPPMPSDVERGIGQLPPAPPDSANADAPETQIKNMFHEVWNWRLLDRVRHYFADTIAAESASQRKMHGHNEYQAYVLGLLAPFPDLVFTPEHVCSIGNARDGYRVATRWRIRGTHTGYGTYGPPTGRPVHIMGITHHLVKDGKIQNEWTVFDEFTLLKQIHAPTSQ